MTKDEMKKFDEEMRRFHLSTREYRESETPEEYLRRKKLFIERVTPIMKLMMEQELWISEEKQATWDSDDEEKPS